MVRFLLLLFCLLLPAPAYAEPVSISALLGVSMFWATVISVTVGAVVSYGLTLAANALFARPKPSAYGRISDLGQKLISNTKGTTVFIPVVYGRHKVGGIRIFEEVNSSYLYMVVIFSEGPIDSIETIYIDGVDATDSRFSGYVLGYTFLGTDDQSVTGWTLAIGSGTPDFITSQVPKWTADHRVLGCAGVAMRVLKNARLFPRIPEITAIVKGRTVYDPRTLTTAYSTNPSLCLRDYLTNSRYGAAIATSRLDADSWTDAANWFEGQVDYGGGNQDRFEMNGIIETSNRLWDNIEDMLLACNSMLKRVNGKHGLLPMKAETVSFNFTDDNILSGIQVSRTGRRFKKNKFNLTFINPNTDWQPDIYIESDATYKAQDNNIDLVGEVDLLHVTDRYQASHIAKVALRSSRLEEKFQFKTYPNALKVEVGDVADITHALYGYSSYQTRITSLTIEPDGMIGVSAEEYDSDVYDVASANPAVLGGTTTFDSPFNVTAPGTPSVALTYTTNSAGFVVNVITLTWSASPSPMITKYLVEYRVTGDTDWILASEPENTTVQIVDLVAGTYDFAVSAMNSIGRVSDRATRSSVGVVNNTATPADVTGFTHEFVSGNQIVLKWDENSDVTSGGGYRIKVSNNTTGAAWSDFPQLNVLIDGRETTATLGLLEGTYMIKAENLGGTQSENMASLPILLPDNDEWVSISTVTESTQFTGTKSQVVVSTGTLMLDTSSSGGYYTTGTYTWANTIDFGGTFACRLTRVSSGTLSNTAANWDSFTGNMDDYTTVMMDDMGGASSVDVRHYFGTTTESASTGPWGSYHQLQMAETVARQLRFQTTIETSANTETPNIQQLSGTAWMKRRSESGSNVSVSSSGGTVNFSAGFYATPTIRIFPFNPSPGQYVTALTSQMSRTGFEVLYNTSSGGQTSGNLSWEASGYGKEST